MKRAVTILMFLVPCILHAQPKWQVDSASVTFKINNAGLPVRGSFTGLEADIRFNPEDPEGSAILAAVDASTVDTGIGLRNKHLRKRDYFHVDRHPRIRMESVLIEKSGLDDYTGTFLLDIKNIQQEVSVPFTFDARDRRATLTGSFTVKRLDFELGEESLILADHVTVHVAIEVTREDDRWTPEKARSNNE